MSKPTVVCICGSTKFFERHYIERWKMERTGEFICLAINYIPGSFAEQIGLQGHDHFGEQLGLKELLDELHLRKIDLSEEVFVVNVGGYVGESTQREIAYAIWQGKAVRFLEPAAGEAMLSERAHAIGAQVATFSQALRTGATS